MKTKQVLHVIEYGEEYRVIKHYGKNNPYRIYQDVRTIENGVLKERRILRESYGNLASCFYWFIDNNIGY